MQAPLKRIEEMINTSHVKLARQVEQLMVDNENELRREIKKVLVEFNPAHDQPTPLEQQRSAPAARG